MVCSCHEAGACVHKTAAVLAWQAEQGRRDIVREGALLAEPPEAPRTRDEVRQAVHRTLHEVVGMGLGHLSPASEVRFKTLATTAHGVELPRLERLLHGLADEIAAWLRRDAHASSESLLARAAQVEALASALERPLPALVGRHRSRYDRVGELDLAGMGARAWRTRSGYVGLTVYFWDVAGRRWNTWTDARPAGTPGFDPAARFTAPGPWTGCPSPADAATSRFRLAGAWRNAAGRLSGRETTHMIPMEPSSEAVPVATASWTALAAKAWELFGLGLTEPEELAPVMLLRPRAWGDSVYDEVEQELRVDILDDEGRALTLALAHSEGSLAAIERLEQAVGHPPPAILGTLHLRRGRLAVAPISLIDGSSVVSLGLDPTLAGPAAVAAAGTAPDDGVEESEGEGPSPAPAETSPGPLGGLLSSAAAELERLAESGSAAYRGWPRLRELGQRGESMGLPAVGGALRRVADAAGADDEARPHRVAEACLRAAYVVRLATSSAAVAAAAAAFG
jgi:hypothetical protein